MKSLSSIISRKSYISTNLQQIRFLPRWNHRRPVKVIASEEYDEEKDMQIKQKKELRELVEDLGGVIETQMEVKQKHPKHASQLLKDINKINKPIEYKIKTDPKPLTITKKKQIPKKAVSFDMLETVIDRDGNFVYTKMENKDPRVSEILIEAKSKKEKDKKDLILLEGKRLIKEALDAGCKLDYILFSRMKELEYIRPSLPKMGAKLYKMPYREMQLWSDLTTNPGIMGIFKIPDPETIKIPKGILPVTVICDNIREANNLGAILRTCSGVGTKEMLLTKGCVNVWDTKVLRTACGAHFKLHIQRKLDWTKIRKLIAPGSSIYIADNNIVSGTEDNDAIKAIASVPVLPYYSVDVSNVKHITLIIGGETEGISEESYKMAAEFGGVRLNIPLSNEVESLNSSMALGIILFEMKKQMVMSKLKNTNIVAS